MRISTIPVIFVVASTIHGCADKSAASQDKFAQAVLSAKSEGLISKADQQIEHIARRVGVKRFVLPSPLPSDKDFAGKATAALVTYFQVVNVDRSVVSSLVEIMGSVRRMKPEFSALLDSAAKHLESKISRGYQSEALAFPNYAVYDFIKAVFQLLSDDIFEVNNSKDIESALKCASGDFQNCKGKSNSFNDAVVGLMNRLRILIQSEPDLNVDLPKLFFAPLYIFFNYESIPIDIREFALKLLSAGMELIENAPKDDPQAAAEYFAGAMSRIQLTDAEKRMLLNIQVNLKLIASRIDERNQLVPNGILRLSNEFERITTHF